MKEALFEIDKFKREFVVKKKEKEIKKNISISFFLLKLHIIMNKLFLETFFLSFFRLLELNFFQILQ